MVKSAYIHIPFCNNICSYCDFCKLLYNKDFVKKFADEFMFLYNAHKHD